MDEDDEEEEDGEDRSLDLLIKFVQNVFKKISRKARKAVRSVLPINISTKLVCKCSTMCQFFFTFSYKMFTGLLGVYKVLLHYNEFRLYL